MEPIIEVKNAVKVYRVGSEKILAVDNVSFTINKGDFCCLLRIIWLWKIYAFKYYGWNREDYVWRNLYKEKVGNKNGRASACKI